MSPLHEDALQAAEWSLGSVPERERPDTEALVKICVLYWRDAITDPGSWTKDAARLVEVLARRSSQAMPYAALGRALLADLHGDQKLSLELLREFRSKLAQLGL